MTTSARPTSDAVSPAAGQPGSGQGNSPGRVQLPPPGRVRQGLALLLVLLSFGLLWRYGGRHSGSIEWGYRIIYGAPAFAGFLLLRVRRLRWAVGAILCACITISYLDRNTMGLAVTAIRDMTLSIVPKLVAMGVVGLLFGNWMLQVMLRFFIEIFSYIQNVGH